jgi:hypothetical protein
MSNAEVLRQQARYAHRTGIIRNKDYVQQFRDWASDWADTQPLGASGINTSGMRTKSR